MFKVALFTLAKIFKQHKYGPSDEWVKRLWCSCLWMHCYSSLQKKGIFSFTAQKNLEDILNKVGQIQKDTYERDSLICEILKQQTNT